MNGLAGERNGMRITVQFWPKSLVTYSPPKPPVGLATEANSQPWYRMFSTDEFGCVLEICCGLARAMRPPLVFGSGAGEPAGMARLLSLLRMVGLKPVVPSI